MVAGEGGTAGATAGATGFAAGAGALAEGRVAAGAAEDAGVDPGSATGVPVEADLVCCARFISSSIVTTSAPPPPSRFNDRSNMRASSEASPRDGSMATVRISRPDTPAAASTCSITPSICVCCASVARTIKLFELALTVTNGAAAPDGSLANICVMVCAISAASALRSVTTRTSGAPPCGTDSASSCATI